MFNNFTIWRSCDPVTLGYFCCSSCFHRFVQAYELHFKYCFGYILQVFVGIHIRLNMQSLPSSHILQRNIFQFPSIGGSLKLPLQRISKFIVRAGYLSYYSFACFCFCFCELRFSLLLYKNNLTAFVNLSSLVFSGLLKFVDVCFYFEKVLGCYSTVVTLLFFFL